MKILLRLKNLSYIQPTYQSIDQIHHMAIAYSTYSPSQTSATNFLTKLNIFGNGDKTVISKQLSVISYQLFSRRVWWESR
ncbi:MAG: hypothetical protein ACFCUV_10755 [Rivularia sp. (in: cyanobacteria)]